ncbi:hypothetical protein BH18THE1_BH18THE1_19190 [soil metagenome]
MLSKVHHINKRLNFCTENRRCQKTKECFDIPTKQIIKGVLSFVSMSDESEREEMKDDEREKMKDETHQLEDDEQEEEGEEE